MTYDEIKKHAIAKCDEWFLSNPVYFHNKAKLIAERWEAHNKELARLNPQKMLTFRDPKTGIWYPEATKHFAVVDYYFPERKEPSWIDPIWACVGKPVTKWNSIKHCNENTTKTVLPSNKDDALLIYVAALLILHDGAAINGAGLEIITENVWPKEQSPILWASYFFETNDRTTFIESALMHVEADPARRTAKEKTLNASAIPPKTDATKNVSAEAKAVAILIDNPDWSDTRIAGEAGINRTTLYKFPKFREGRRLLKEQGKKSLPSGSKDGETGDMEAWEQ